MIFKLVSDYLKSKIRLNKVYLKIVRIVASTRSWLVCWMCPHAGYVCQ